MPVPEGSSPFSNLGCRHVALWKEIAAQAISDLASIDTVILLFCCRDRPQHEGMSDLRRGSVWLQMIIDPAREDGRLHGYCPWLRKSLDPDVEFPTSRADLPFLANSAAHIFDTVADGLLVYIQSDVIHMSFEEPPWFWSESTWPLSSALSTPRAPLGLSIQTVSRVFQRVVRVTPHASMNDATESVARSIR